MNTRVENITLWGYASELYIPESVKVRVDLDGGEPLWVEVPASLKNDGLRGPRLEMDFTVVADAIYEEKARRPHRTAAELLGIVEPS